MGSPKGGDRDLSIADSGFVASRQTERQPNEKGIQVSKATAKFSGLAVFFYVLAAALFTAAPASAACPNEVFRTGPSANLPECRAFELVTPEYSGGIKPTARNFSNMTNAFDFPLITASGDSVTFNTESAALSGSAGSGFSDRYVAKRTADGWKTQFIGPTAAETSRPEPGGVSADHLYYFLNAGQGDYFIEPESTLQAPWGGLSVVLLHKPNGEFEPVAKGTLGVSREAVGRLITPGATHVIFDTQAKLESKAAEGMTNIYDRSPGGPTHVLSLLPGDVTPTAGTNRYLGASLDGEDVVFEHLGDSPETMYVRHNNSVTREVGRAGGVRPGKELKCSGGGGESQTYQWLRNGTPIAGANDSTYTAAAADEGSVLQCEVAASTGEGSSLQTSLPAVVVAPFEGKSPPYVIFGAVTVEANQEGFRQFADIGETITCIAGGWEGNPTYSYQWLREGAPIPGETGSTYTTTNADSGKALQCRVTGSNADGNLVAYSSPVPVYTVTAHTSEVPQVANVSDPGNAPEAGDELSCAPGTWSGSPSYSYQWLRNGAAIAGATSATYTVTASDAGTVLQCAVTAATASTKTVTVSNHLVADPQPATTPPSPAEVSFGPGTIFGGNHPGEGLFCSSGEWAGEPSFSYQWLRDGAEIPGANGESYVLTAADVGTVVGCRITGTNAGGSTAVAVGTAFEGPRQITPNVPTASSSVLTSPLVYDGVFGGNVFYGDRKGSFSLEPEAPGDLYSYDISSGETTAITDTGDALYSHVSEDGSHVYFVSQSEIGGEGIDGEWNLYVWARSDESTTYITTVEPHDAQLHRQSQGDEGANTASWAFAMDPGKESVQGRANSDTRSTPDGSVFLFQTTRQLTSFNNTEATPEDCISTFESGEGCQEAYLYDTKTKELTCISCPPGGTGPATGHVSFFEWNGVTNLNAPSNLTEDGSTVFFESTEDLLPQDGNGRRDVYRWKKGSGLALISTGQETTDSHIYGINPSGRDVAILTTEKLLPQDENGGTERIYDARVNGGFPPPESSVTEPCNGDACQGNPSAPAQQPSIASSSLNGSGNVKPKVQCPKGKRKVVRHGKERCVKRKHHKHHRRAHHKRKAAK